MATSDDSLVSNPSQTIDRFFRSGLRLNQLRILVSLAELGQVKLVAHAHHVTQSAISKQLAEMEAAIGVPLLARNGRMLRFTVAGEAVAKRGKEVLLQLELGRRELNDLSRGYTARVAVGAVSTVTQMLLPLAIARFRSSAPDTFVSLQEGTTDRLFTQLADGELDIVVCRTPAELDNGIFVETLIDTDPYMVVCGAHHPLARRKKPRWTDLRNVPWILPPAHSAIFTSLIETLASHQLELPPGCMESTSITAIPQLLASTQSLAPLPASFADDLERRGVGAMLPLGFAPAGSAIRALTRRSAMTSAAQLMLDCIREVAAQT